MVPHPALSSIIQDLERHQHALRLKKLLIYTAQNHLESDIARLQSLSLWPILEQLPQQFPSIWDLRRALDVSVKKLSRPQTYRVLSDVLMRLLQPLYIPVDRDDQEGMTRVVTCMQQNTHCEDNKRFKQTLLAVTRKLEQHQNSIRIKKLLFTLCSGRWENELSVLKKSAFVMLVKQIQRRYPSPYKLSTALQKLVNSLNNQSTYIPLGNFILEVTYPLYQHSEISQELSTPPFPPITLAQPGTKSSVPDVQYQGFMSLSDRPAKPEPLPTNFDISKEDLPSDISSLTEIEDPSLQQTEKMEDLPVDDLENLKGPVTRAEISPPSHFADLLNIVELRLEVMKYANPLRVKILLFSAVHHPFDLSVRDWSLLSDCDLDDLLTKAIRASTNLVALEIRLAAIAKSLFDPKDHLQANADLIQAIKLLSQSV